MGRTYLNSSSDLLTSCLRLAFGLLFAISSYSTQAQQASHMYDDGWQGYFSSIGSNFVGSFTGVNFANHVVAAGTTYALVETDVDQRFANYFVGKEEWQILTFPAVILGGAGAVALPAYLHFSGVQNHNRQKVYAAYAAGQSVILSVTVTSLYKAFTGREHPGIFDSQVSSHDSRNFRYGFLRGGIFHGWPSGHATTSMAIATSLTYIYPDRKADHLKWILGAVYVAAGISTNIHWLSDSVAGMLVGYSIGRSVGQHYGSILHNRSQKNTYQIFPQVGRGSFGIKFHFNY